MSYTLKFHVDAVREWEKLDWTIQKQFLSVLEKRLEAPRVQSAKLREAPDCYKIKLRAVGYRLVYQVVDAEVVVLVLAVGKREGEIAYRKMRERL
jgi:mRNA interferase RelE/StbE